MGLTGTGHDFVITKIPYCEFEGDGLDSHGEVSACGDVAHYRVAFKTGEILHACDEHAQRMWDTDNGYANE